MAKAKDSKDMVLSPSSSSSQKEDLPRLPPLKECPPPIEQPQRSITPTSIDSFEPLSEVEISIFLNRSCSLPPRGAREATTSTTHSRDPLLDVVVEPNESTDVPIASVIASPRVYQFSAERSSPGTGNENIRTTNGSRGVPKKVAFISPAPAPTTSSFGIERPSVDDVSATSKRTVMRPPTMHSGAPLGSIPTTASTSRTDVGSSKNGIPTIEATTKRPSSPYPAKPGSSDGASIHYSFPSGNPFSQKWTKGLVTNLGPRERTRQEVLSETVASEERYVSELTKTKETLIEPLPHPHAISPIASPAMLEHDDMSRLVAPSNSDSESLEHLPIASRFLSPTGFRSATTVDHASRREDKDTPNVDTESDDNDRLGKGFQESRRAEQGYPDHASKRNHPRSPYSTSRSGKNLSVPFPSRIHQSLPPPPHLNPNAASNQYLGRQSFVGSSFTKNGISTIKAIKRRPAPSPFPTNPGDGDGVSVHQTLRSGTPFSQKPTGNALPFASWSEGAEEDLVTNLGSRERTRQEVLWEIVASEERYVVELLKMKEAFIVPLLPPSRTMLETPSESESLEYLPIASRFLSPIGFRSDPPTAVDYASRREDKDTPNMESESDLEDDNDGLGKGFQESRWGGQGHPNLASKRNHPRSPYGASRSGKNPPVPFPSRAHQSLPPPPRLNPNAASTSTNPNARMILKKSRKSLTKADLITNGGVVPHQIPDDLRQCLEVIEDSILTGHIKLSESLRKQYDAQYPLVRSLADVFVANSHIFRGYADYILHLERALEQANDAISTSNSTKRPKNKDVDEWLKVSAFLRKLEIDAQDRGETGLAISLSKPFQRLLKYLLLFQNLLFHTDTSTFEYESTLQMVTEVENVVRSIEDEKIKEEERDKTRDILARIEGLDKVKQLAAPRPSRVLVEERMLTPKVSSDASPPPAGTTSVRGKTSFKRLSEVLQSGGGGGIKDIWLVVFNDVVLRCRRTGTISLPSGSARPLRTNLQGKSEYVTTGRPYLPARPRNLYKFIKIENWTIGNVVQPREGVVSMEDVVRSRAQIHSAIRIRPQFTPIPEGDEGRLVYSDDEDHMSMMCVSDWGEDSISLLQSSAKSQLGPLRQTDSSSESSLSLYPGSSLANAKFGSRLGSGISFFSESNLSSHPNGTTPSFHSVISDEGWVDLV